MQPHFERQPIVNNAIEYDEELDDGFEFSVEDHEARHLIERALKRGEHHRAARLARDFREARMERAIRKRIVSVLEAAGGTIGIERLMKRVCDSEGEAAMNATLCLVYVMQNEGTMSIRIPQGKDQIVVELLRRHRR